MGLETWWIMKHSRFSNSTYTDLSSYRWFFVTAPLFGLNNYFEQYSIWISFCIYIIWNSWFFFLLLLPPLAPATVLLGKQPPRVDIHHHFNVGWKQLGCSAWLWNNSLYSSATSTSADSTYSTSPLISSSITPWHSLKCYN